MTRKFLLTAILVSLIGSAATAQPSRRQEGIVRVQLAIQLFVSGPTDESAEAEQQRERARRMLYDMAARECEVMRASMANDCRLESINVNLNRQSGPQQNGYMVMGNMAYQITLK
jgi:hypothetical protein